MLIDARKSLLFFVPLPPPYAGPELSSELLIRSRLKDDFELIVIPSNVHSNNATKGAISLGSILRLWRLMLRLLGTFLFKKPSVVYTILNQNFSGFMRDSIIVLLSKFFHKKVTLHFRGSSFDHFYNNQSSFLKGYIRFTLKMTDALILQSYWVKEQFKLFFPEERLSVIYNAAPPTKSGNGRSTRLPRGNQSVTILYLNHLSVAKGILVLLHALQKTVTSRPDIQFLIAGDPILREKNVFFDEQTGRPIPSADVAQSIQKVQRDPRMKRNVRFVGEVKDEALKEQLFRDADLFVLPSYSEGCPLSVLEAMNAGLPVIVTPVGALREILEEGKNGRFVQPGDADQLRNTIISLADDPQLRMKMGECNRSLIQSKFQIGTIAEQFISVFNSL